MKSELYAVLQSDIFAPKVSSQMKSIVFITELKKESMFDEYPIRRTYFPAEFVSGYP